MKGPATLDRSSAYRRKARQIRGRLAHKPVERYSALRELSHRHDIDFRPANHTPVDQSRTSAFGQIVNEHVHGQVLSYSRRLGLLGVARRLGIGRFEANLIIAAVQHRRGRSPLICHNTPVRHRFRAAPLLTFVLLQSLILISLWGIFLR